MSQTKHTQGPWMHVGAFVYALDDSRKQNRFDAPIYAGYQHGERVPESEIVANAKLMAAAPDLVEALERALQEIRAYGVPDSATDGVMAQGERALRKAGVL